MFKSLDVANVKLFEITIAWVILCPYQLIVDFIHERYDSSILAILKNWVVYSGFGLKQIEFFLERFEIRVTFSFRYDCLH